MNTGRILLLVIVALFVGAVAWQAWQKYRVARANDAAPVREAEAVVLGVRTHTLADPPDMNPKNRTSPVVTRFVRFQLTSGEELELPVTAEQQAQFQPGQRGILKHQGTQFLTFSPRD